MVMPAHAPVDRPASWKTPAMLPREIASVTVVAAAVEALATVTAGGAPASKFVIVHDTWYVPAANVPKLYVPFAAVVVLAAVTDAPRKSVPLRPTVLPAQLPVACPSRLHTPDTVDVFTGCNVTGDPVM